MARLNKNVAARCGRHGMPPPDCKLCRPLSLAMADDSACSNRLPSFKFVSETLSVSALISLVISTFDLLTSNLMRVVALGQNFYPFMSFWDLSFSTYGMGLHLSDVSRDLATFTFNSGGPGDYRRYKIRVFVLHLCTKFEVHRPSHSEDIAH